MKKTLIIVVIVLLCSLYQDAFAQYPIPSYNVTIRESAYFLEDQPTRGRRDANIKTQCVGSSFIENRDIVVYLFTQDLSTVLGPYYLGCGETLTVPIDELPWGVLVESEKEITVDVWMTESS